MTFRSRTDRTKRRRRRIECGRRAKEGVATATNATEEQIVSAAIAGDEAAFTQLVERYRGELQVHAYRMLGSLEDAEDALQEAFFRAWNRRGTYRRESTFRAWLYRITTNACLRILERRPRRLVPYDAGPAAELGTRPVPPADLPWLQPYPDLLLDERPQPEDAVVARETIELAFLAAIQHLPPRQRAVLILRDALDWPADDTAAVLEMSLAAVNSALQRARATLKERLPEARLEWARARDTEDAERSLLEKYVEAFERHTTVGSWRSFARTCGWRRRRTPPGTTDARRSRPSSPASRSRRGPRRTGSCRRARTGSRRSASIEARGPAPEHSRSTSS
jgi:RNA polymerase sigma factor (sigma-70 family)